MDLKKKTALIAAAVCCAVALGGSAYYGIVRNYATAPLTREEESLPATDAPLYTDPVSAPQTTVPVPETTVPAPENASPAALGETESEPESTESMTVSGSLPRPRYFELPLGLDIVLDYSAAEPVFNATMGDWRTHTGVDFAGVTGDPVKASAGGFVTAVYDDPMYGTVMEIDHGGGVTARYCGLGKGSTIAVGTEVKTNDTIAYLGAVPCEADAGAHLHMEIREDGLTVDPLDIFELSRPNEDS